MHPEIIHSDNFLRDALALIERAADTAIFERGTFRIALSGGNTPRPVYEALAKTDAAWGKWIFTFGDERCVPPDDSQSNYRMARESLFDPAAIPPENVLRIPAEENPERAAAHYETTLRQHSAESSIFRHDLVLLGMGDDGHTASLFPETTALEESHAWVVANYVPKFQTHRITMTYPLLNAARHVCFLVNSKGKDEMLKKVFSGDFDFPCTKIRPEKGNLTWLLGA